MKKLYAYFKGKSVKQRICIFVVIFVMFMLLFFTIKSNFIDKTPVPQTDNKLPEFHISFIDLGILFGVITAYSVHKIREKKRQGRL